MEKITKYQRASLRIANPADPIWLVPGADGQDHIVGADGRAYYLKDLPIAAQV